MDNFYLLIIQEFYFSFFLTFYRVNIVAKSNSFSIYGLVILSILVIFGIYYNLHSPIDGLLLMGSATVFPFYLFFASYLEKQNFSKAIHLENISALIAVIFFFIVSLVMHLSDLEWVGLMYLRFFMFFIITISYFVLYQNKQDCFKEINLSKKTSFKEFSSLNVLFLLMVFKFFIVSEGVLSTDSTSLDTKIFLFLYDLIAAIYGFYLRFVVAKKEPIRGMKKMTLLIFGFLSFSLLLTVVFYLSDSVLSEEIIFTLFPSFVLAASFGVFVLNTNKKVNLIYSFILIMSIFFIQYIGLKYTTVLYFLSTVGLLLCMNYNVKYKNIKDHMLKLKSLTFK